MNTNTEPFFCAVRADARFASISFRSVARQRKPDPPLEQVARRQVVSVHKGVSGTLIGFWCPAFFKGINVPALHLHFLSANRRRGEHVLDSRMDDGTAQLDDTSGWEVRLPALPAYPNADLSRDRATELRAIEKGGAGTAPSEN